MSINYFEEKRYFTIDTAGSTYQMKVDDFGFLLHLYYGRRSAYNMEYLLTYADRGFSGNPYDVGLDRTYSMDVLPQEFPTLGTGDYRSPALVIKNADGSYACDLRYKSHKIYPGKYGLKGLPAVYANDEEADTLEITLRDDNTGVEAVLYYGVIYKNDIITRAVQIRNASDETFYIEKIDSACLDFVAGDYDLLTFYGRHCLERNVQRTPIKHGNTSIGSRRGTSSHQYNPLMIIAGSETNEDSGSCYAMELMYSGGFKGEAEKDQFMQTRVQIGVSDEMFSYPVSKDEIFTAPEVILSYSQEGFSVLSHNLHDIIRNNVCRGKYKTIERPVLLNSWEACYFDFDGKAICDLAEQAADLGLDMLVMDDGWFGKRDDDFSGLGDWYVNEEKLGMSLGTLVDQVNALGLKFGIWFEPECVNEDSDLYREHPDWALTIPGRDPVRARYQLVLDFSRKEVVDAIFKQVCDVLDQANIEYVKWDFNRSISDVCSRATADQGKVLYDYVLGLYDFLERLLNRYPDLLLEGCSGGGGRFDAGMMYYTPQIWCSDNTDALDRLLIQYGTSFGYPVSTMGSHVSAVPNHQTGRVTPLSTRAITAMSGTFGYELNPAKMTKKEKTAVRKQIKEYKKYGKLIHNGRYFRLTDPAKDEVGAWEFVSEEGKEVLMQCVKQQMHGNMTVNYVKFKGLPSGALYRDKKTKNLYPSDALMEMGLPLPVEMGDYNAYQIYLERIPLSFFKKQHRLSD